MYMYVYVRRIGQEEDGKGEMSEEGGLTFESLNLEFECTPNKKWFSLFLHCGSLVIRITKKSLKPEELDLN